MNNKGSIRYKITKMVLTVSIISLLILGLATVANLNIIKSQLLKSSSLLGETASTDSEAALEQQTRQNLETITSYLAQVADTKLGIIKNASIMLANTATDIFTYPDNYYPMNIVPPLTENDGKVVLYYTKPLGVSRDSVIGEARNAANAGTFMKQILLTNPAVLTNYISFNDGLHVICDANSGLRTKADYDYNPTTRAWFIGAQERGEAGFTDIVNDAQGRGLGVVCSTPFYDKSSQIRGVVGIGALISEIDELILTADLGETGEAFVLNNQGQMIIGKDITLNDEDKFIRPNLSEDQAINAMNLTDGGSGVETVQYKDRAVYMAWTHIDAADWTLVTTIEVDEALALSRQTVEKINALAADTNESINTSIIWAILFIVLIVFLTAASVIWVATRQSKHITDPLQSLTQSVGEISGGNLEIELELKTGDEIETLADSVNDMTHQLKEYIENLTAVTAEKERIGAELNIATQIQASMLPCIFPPYPDREEFDIFASMNPAKEVGGDFYDFFLVDDDHLAVVMADVSGKGVPAALFMVIAKTLIKNYTMMKMTADEAFTKTNEQLCENNDAEMFVTAWMGIWEISTGNFTYVNAGHNPPLLKKADGSFEYLKSPAGFVLAGMEGMKYRQQKLQLSAGDHLFLYTDGAPEATNIDDELYGDERLLTLLNENTDKTPSELLAAVKEDIERFVGEAPQFDDITMLALYLK